MSRNRLRTWTDGDLELATLDFSWTVMLDYLGVRYTTRRSGKLYALCVLHEERTASCVHRPDGTFYCFGCQRGGSAIEFIDELRASSRGSWLSESATEVILRAHATSMSSAQLSFQNLHRAS